MLLDPPVFRIMGDRSLLVELGDRIAPRINQEVISLYRRLVNEAIAGISDLIPCYRSILVVYDPLSIETDELKKTITRIRQTAPAPSDSEERILNVPVVYGGEFGPDLEWVAAYHRISPNEVIRIHTAPTYRVYMIGFTPGHPYLGQLPDTLQPPRKSTPRASVPGGSVGIAQKQIVIYPVESPGGFQIIGRTPLTLFQAEKYPPALFRIGDRVKFYAATEKDVSNWKQ